MKRFRNSIFLGLALVAAAIGLVSAQSLDATDKSAGQVSPAEQEAAWKRLRSMVGIWRGSGEPGDATVEQRYEMIVNGTFLHVQTKSVSRMDRHEDWEIYSFDSTRKKVVLRQFVSEGFVNQYVLERLENDGRTLVFVSEACESAPAGFRTRQTLTFEDDNRISQQLELSPAGKPFSRCSMNTLTRDK